MPIRPPSPQKSYNGFIKKKHRLRNSYNKHYYIEKLKSKAKTLAKAVADKLPINHHKLVPLNWQL